MNALLKGHPKPLNPNPSSLRKDPFDSMLLQMQGRACADLLSECMSLTNEAEAVEPWSKLMSLNNPRF